jgi:outer membrane receptor protein involved in Fe transport
LVYRSSWIAETFQLRFGLSETAIRPDLREVMDATYIDPATGELVYGNTDVVPAASTNLDLRADWFFDNGNSFTLSLFNKEIDDPIEFFEKAASDTNTAREIVNAESTSITGLELEGLYELGALGAWGETLFVKGNATFQDSETTAGASADAPTNNVRPASGASDYVVNFMVGYDSQDGRHMGSIMFNVFGERLYTAGRNGAEDLYEQPFNSFDATYSFYPTENLILKVKLMNLLDEAITIERDGVLVFEEKPGMAISASAKYDF